MAIIFPRPLDDGDKVAIISPASIINPQLVDGAVDTLRAAGLNPVVAPHALDRSGNYAGSAAHRLADITAALRDPSTRAILCSRGGYGAVHLLQSLACEPLADDPKWIVGFSDISALHALMSSRGIASIHASMAKQLTHGPADPLNRCLLSMLRGERPGLAFGPDSHNRHGQVRGRLVGGNLAVLAQLIGTPFDVFSPGTVLFIEDISEPIYKVERILYQLRLSGVLASLAGLIVGRFTGYQPDANYARMDDMVADMTAPYGYPVAFGAPVGHIDDNHPMIEGAEVELSVDTRGTVMTYVD